MAKLTIRDIWNIAKDEPLYRVGAFILSTAALSYIGFQLSPYWGIWRTFDQRPRPPLEGLYRIGDDCFSFAQLPEGWRPARQIPDGKVIGVERTAGGGHARAYLVPHSDEEPFSKGNPPVCGDAEHSGLAGYIPCIYEGEDLIYFSDASRRRGRYVHCLDLYNSGWRPNDKFCLAQDQGLPGKYGVQISYDGDDPRSADPLLDEGYKVLRSGIRSCAT